jgi:hypothetical protein
MRIFGHPWIASEVFRRVFSVDDIQKIRENETALLEPLTESIKLAQYCQEENVSFAVTLGSIRDALFANELGASYLVCQHEEAMEIQPIAQTYLFDALVLVLIENEKEIDRIARFSIDGVIFPKAII